MNVLKTFLTMLGGLIPLSCFAQGTIALDAPRLVPVSPTAAAMEKYQTYPVNHCTGIPNITIPLYELKVGELIIPITLSYHAAGIKPKEGSGWMGTGWTLNLEPSVSRIINGVADEDSKGWLYRNNPSNRVPYELREKLIFYGEITDHKRDTQPDRFVYKLPQGGGSGYFYDLSTPLITIPRTNDEVTFVGNMKITDDKGFRYLFDGANETTDRVPTRWMCTSILSNRDPSQTLIRFQYEKLPWRTSPSTVYQLDDKLIINPSDRAGYGSRMVVTQVQDNRNSSYQVAAPPKEPGLYKELPNAVLTYTYANGYYEAKHRVVANNMTFSRLTGADFLGNRLTVSYTAIGESPYNGEVIDEINVFDESGSLVRKIAFYITPYHDRTTLSKLDSVKISAPSVEPKVYSFLYYSETSVPDIYTMAVDHWGFCNGWDDVNNRNTLRVPNFKIKLALPDVNGVGYKDSVIYTNKGMDREPHHDWTKVGALAQIIDPYGVQTSFYYEGNHGAFRQYSRSGTGGEKESYLHPVGGLRTERIEVFDPKTDKRLTRQYRYGLTIMGDIRYGPVWGGGAIKHWVTERDYCSNLIIGNSDSNLSTTLTIYDSMPISNICFDNGSAAMYNIVEERVYDREGIDLTTHYYYDVEMHPFEGVLKWNDKDVEGSIRKFFWNQPESILNRLCRRLPAHPQEPAADIVSNYSGTNQRYGALIRTEYFKGGDLIASTDYKYRMRRGWDGNISFDIPFRRVSQDIDDYMKHNPTVYPMFEVNNQYTQTDKVPTIYYLDTEQIRALDQEIAKEYSGRSWWIKEIATAKQYRYISRTNGPKNPLRPSFVETTNSDSTKVIDRYDYLEDYPGILSYHKQEKGDEWRESRILFKPNSNLPDTIQFRTNRMKEYTNVVVYGAYDKNNNVVEVIGKDGTPLVFFWSYRNQYPIAKIENATRQQVIAALGHGADSENVFERWADAAKPSTEMWNKLNSLRYILPHVRVTTYAYEPLRGVISITDPNGMVSTFDYDNYSRLLQSSFLDAEGRRRVLEQYIYNFVRQ